MQGPTAFVAVLSALLAVGAALPQTNVLPRAAYGARKPKYSIVPLEPGDDGRRGSGTPRAQTVVETVVKTQEPITKTITRTGAPVTVTEAPTSVPVVPIGGGNTNTIVTMTVYVTQESTSRGRTTPATATATSRAPCLPTPWHVPHGNSTANRHPLGKH
ncbi:hypothetical protein E4U42_004632 [Claviceps africana]|uniref:Uncharacterized protein n=1 Tax=Claviceps africana TaxID=83212 RepID=A0A8K0J754_9HYPO|nr:hypothetical protein E4U42_004632 [Claviceps africana]